MADPDRPHTGGFDHPTWFWPQGGATVLTDDGIDPTGEPFDMSLVLKTGHINQVLRAQWSDYDGFGVGGLGDVLLTARPTLPPHTLMARDPRPGEAPGRFPVSYQVGQFLVEATNDSGLLARWAVDLNQEDLLFYLDPVQPDVLQVKATTDDMFTWTPLEITIPGCVDRSFLGAGTSCVRAGTRRVGEIVEPILLAKLYALLADLPAPTTFGELPVDVTYNPDRWWREDQTLTFYADLTAP